MLNALGPTKMMGHSKQMPILAKITPSFNTIYQLK